jgi:hypothetical protein
VFTCHGPGKGDGSMASAINPPEPSDLTDASWKHAPPTATVIRDGAMGTSMRGAARMKPDDTWNVVNYLRTLPHNGQRNQPDDLPESALAILRSEGWDVDARSGRKPEELALDLADADALIVRSATKVTKDLLAAAPKLRIIGRAGSGVDNIDMPAASGKGVLVVNAPGANRLPPNSAGTHAVARPLGSRR